MLTSRWLTLPDGVREADGLAPGFRAAGVACGIKPSGERDLALLVCDGPAPASAARFTRSGTLAAPVLLCQERCALGELRAVVANSGNANAATGRRGLEDAVKVQGAGSAVAGVAPAHVAVASTGVIGVPLPVDPLVRGLVAARDELRADGDADLAEAIRTTDAFAKRATVQADLSGGTVVISGQAKGAGMIAPSCATMLCFVQTDAALEAQTADLLLGATVARTFDRVSVDGQLSTNDTVLLMASGASGVRVEGGSDDELRLGEALEAVLRALALAVVRDGEGARRVGRVLVSGGHAETVERVARSVADSPLVKTALHGADPNWGRILQAAGAAVRDAAPLPCDIWIEDVQVCAGGAAVPYDADALADAVAGDEVQYAIGLPGEGAEVELFFSSLGHEYVTINADYTT
jgi:glutamate N-acetyltransferase/amino-acid N-acetyltransferase